MPPQLSHNVQLVFGYYRTLLIEIGQRCSPVHLISLADDNEWLIELAARRKLAAAIRTLDVPLRHEDKNRIGVCNVVLKTRN